MILQRKNAHGSPRGERSVPYSANGGDGHVVHVVVVLHIVSTAFSGAIVVGLSEIPVTSPVTRHIGPSHSSSFN